MKLDKFGVCDGGVDFIPDPAATTFSNEVFQSDISSLTVSADDATVMVAQCIIPSSSGGYTIRGIAIYTDDGTLYATGNYPAQPKPAPDSGFAASLEILAQLAVSDTADVSLTVTEGNFLTETQGNTLYLRQDKRLSEIAAAGAEAQSAARDNLALGTAATATLTTSTTDSTAGRVLTVGYEGIGGDAVLLVGNDFNQLSPSGFIHGQTNTPIVPSLFMGFNVRHMSSYQFTLVGRNQRYFAQTCEAGEFQGWDEFFTTKGGNLTGKLGFLFSTPRESADCSIPHADANGKLAAMYGYYQDRFDIHFYDDEGAWASNPVAIWRNGDCKFGNVFDNGQRVYSPNNPPPATDLSAYATTSWVNQYFLQGIRLSALSTRHFDPSVGYEDGAVVTSMDMVGGSSNVGDVWVRYIQQNINGVWTTISIL